jgi:hypothetical protein
MMGLHGLSSSLCFTGAGNLERAVHDRCDLEHNEQGAAGP